MKKKKKNSKQFNKKFKKQFFTAKSVIVIVLTMIIIAFLWFGTLHQNRRAARYRESIDQLTSEVKDIENQNKELEEEKESADSDEFKERIAREKLGLVGKDEYQVKESEGQDEEEATSASDEK